VGLQEYKYLQKRRAFLEYKYKIKLYISGLENTETFICHIYTRIIAKVLISDLTVK